MISPLSARTTRRGRILSLLAVAAAQGCAGVPAPSTTGAPVATSTSAARATQTVGVTRPLVARVQPPIPLWSAGAPGALGTDSTDRPQITPYLPPAGRANGTAVVVFPGGGYRHLSMVKEGSDV